MARVAAIIPCYDGERFVAAAIESALGQSYSDLQVVAVNDGSTDGTREVISRYRDRVLLLEQPNRGTQRARNAAIDATESEYVAILDQDDRWLPAKIERQVRALDQNPDAGVCFTQVRTVREEGAKVKRANLRFREPKGREEGLRFLIERNPFAASSALIRRRALRDVGGFSPDYPLAADWELWLRIAACWRVLALPEPLTEYRLHGANFSLNALQMHEQTVAVFEKLFEQRDRLLKSSSEPEAMKSSLRRAARRCASCCSVIGFIHARAGRSDLANAWHEKSRQFAPATPAVLARRVISCWIARGHANSGAGSVYFRQARPEMLEFVPAGVRRVLDVGCGAGEFGALVKRERQAEVWGIEMDPAAARAAAAKLDCVMGGDVRRLLEKLPKSWFDCVVFNDVLEHIEDPYRLLVVIKDSITPQGCVVASIPNIRYFGALKEILYRKDFPYEDAGIFDKTHVRFFTKRSIERMFAEAGYRLEIIKGINGITAAWFPVLNSLTLNTISDMRYLQFACLAKPISRTEPDEAASQEA